MLKKIIYAASLVLVFQSNSFAGPLPNTGDVFSGNSSGPTITNQPGVGGSPYCRQRDAECGGSDRRCYDDAYNSRGIVMSVQQSQNLYQQTHGQIWIRCGACGDKTICWPRPGYQDLIASNDTGNKPQYIPGQDVFSSGVQGGSGGDVYSGQGNPNCPPPVINGVVPKNWSCKTGTQGGGWAIVHHPAPGSRSVRQSVEHRLFSDLGRNK